MVVDLAEEVPLVSETLTQVPDFEWLCTQQKEVQLQLKLLSVNHFYTTSWGS
jgi:hypothetical protein